MQISVGSSDSEISHKLGPFVERRAYFNLGRYVPRLKRVLVRLEDVNGPRGGNDKRCRVVLRVAKLTDTVVEVQGDSWHAVVARALERAERALGRSIERHRTLTNGSGTRLVSGFGTQTNPDAD
jgi:hypothetical protein